MDQGVVGCPQRDGDCSSSNYLALSDTETVDCYAVPSPVYPSLPGRRRGRDQMTRHQIINLYCTNSDRER